MATAPTYPVSRAVSVDGAKHKYFGRCLLKNGDRAVIVAKAADESEASRKLHAGYSVQFVEELIREDAMPREWAKIKPSLLQRSALF